MIDMTKDVKPKFRKGDYVSSCGRVFIITKVEKEAEYSQRKGQYVLYWVYYREILMGKDHFNVRKFWQTSDMEKHGKKIKESDVVLEMLKDEV